MGAGGVKCCLNFLSAETGASQPRVPVVFEWRERSGHCNRQRFKTNGSGRCDLWLPQFESGSLFVEGRPDTRQAIACNDAVCGRGITIVCPSGAADEWTIKGIVTDESGWPVEGISLLAEGTNHGWTTTKADGLFAFCVDPNKTYDLRISSSTRPNSPWYKGRGVSGVVPGSFKTIVLEADTGLEVLVRGFFDKYRFRLLWEDLWLEGRDGQKISFESRHGLGSRVLFYGVPCGADLRAVIRFEDGSLRCSPFVAIEEGRSRMIVMDETRLSHHD